MARNKAKKKINYETLIYKQDALDKMKKVADRAYEQAIKSGSNRIAEVSYNAVSELCDNKNPYYAMAYQHMLRVPVTIDEFIESTDFLGDLVDVWDSLRDDLREMNPDIFIGDEPVYEVFDGGATGTGKTTKAMITQAYQLYVLTCFRRPQLIWPNLSKITPIVFMFQSVQERITKRVIYEPFREMFTNMPYCQKYCQWDKYKDTSLEFDTGLIVAPALASIQSMVGQAIVGGIMDEVNFMSVVEQSKLVAGPRGDGGKYDQAEITYRNITRRRKSRFSSKGPSPGAISVISSVRYLDDFMDRRMKEIVDNEEENTIIFRRTQYEVQPQSRYSGETMRVLVGSTEYGTRILKDEESAPQDYPENADVREVPIEYKQDFIRDPEGALRDVIGVATDVISPFITQRHKIIEAIVRGTKMGLQPMVVKPDVDLAEDGMPQINEDNLPEDKDRRRFVHIDLSTSKDRCGIAIVKVMGHVAQVNENNIVENLPFFVLEQGISIRPSANAEIDIADIRNWVIMLKDYYGLNIHTVSYDGFQSKESLQILRKQGILSDCISMDRTTEPYEHLKRTIYQDRFACMDHELLKVELGGLEMNSKQNKIDHPPKGSKDLADAVAGAVYSAMKNRNVRADSHVESTSSSNKGKKTTKRKRVGKRKRRT